MKYRVVDNYNYFYSKQKFFMVVLFAMLFLSLVYLIVTKTYSADVSWSTYDGVHYRFTNSSKQGGTLIIGKSDSIETFTNRSSRMVSSYGWFLGEGNNISAIRVEGTVNGSGSMAGMLGYYTNATTIDLTNFKTTNVTNMDSMFYACQNLRILKLGSNFSFKSTNVSLTGSWKRDGDTTVYTAADLVANYNGSMAGTYRRVDVDVYAMVYSNNEMVFQIGNTPDSSKGNLLASYNGFETISTPQSSAPWDAYKSSITKVTFNTGVAPKTTASWFYQFTNLTTITNLWKLDTSQTVYMNGMFADSTSLTTLDVRSFDTSSVRQMTYMFGGCTGLTALNVSNFDTSNVINMESMFHNCANLTNLDLSNFDTSNVTDMDYMFQTCSKLENLDLSSFDMGGVGNNITYMFAQCTSLRTIKLSNRCEFAVSTGYSGGTWKRDGDTATYTGQELLNSNTSVTAGTYRNTDLVYAILYSSGRLVFQIGNTPNSSYGTVVATYSGIETTDYSSYSQIPWNAKRSSITTVMFNTEVAPISTTYWFYNCTNLTGISYLNRLVTSSVTNMSYMFYNCNKITSLSTGSFNTSNVTDMRYMFASCNSLTSLTLTSFNTSNVTNMYAMFSGCGKIGTLNLSSFNTTNVTNMNYMFSNMISLTQINLGTNFSFKTALVDLTGEWKRSSTGVVYTAADLISNYNGSTMSGVYNKIPYAAILYDDGELVFQYGTTTDAGRSYTNIYTGYVYNTYTSASQVPWHQYASEIKTITFKDEIKPISTAFWFQDCNNLENINNIENLKTNNVAYMNYMFKDCSSLKEIDISSFDVTNCYDTSYMFSGCTNLTSINMTGLIIGLNVPYPHMDYMFQNCSSLIFLDLDINTINVSTMDMMFDGTTSLRVLNFGDAFKRGFSGLDGYWRKDGESTTISAYELESTYDATKAGVYRRINYNIDVDNFETIGILYDSGELVFSKFGMVPTIDYSKGQPVSYYHNFESETYTTASDVPWYNDRLSITKVTFNDAIIPASTAFWFSDCTNLKGFNSKNLNTILTTTMNNMFQNCTSLNSLELNTFDTKRVTNMNFMFKGSTNLASLDISSFDNDQATMTQMFMLASGLRVLKLGKDFKFKVTGNLQGNWKRDGDNTTYTSSDFYDMYEDEEEITPGIYRNITKQVYAMVYSNGEMVFQIGNTVDTTKGNLVSSYTNFETETFDYASETPWYSKRTQINKIIFDTTVVPVSTGSWFASFSNLTSIVNLNLLNTTNVTNMHDMFANCTKLVDLDLSNFNTSNVEIMKGMFSGCSNLISLDLSNFDTSNVNDMADMFSNCTNLLVLDLSSFDTSNVSDMHTMFIGCENLTSINLSNFDTSKVEDMSGMFASCLSLTYLDLNNFDTSNVTDMTAMFFDCEGLKALNLSNFDTTKVEKLTSMFEMCYALENLNISSFQTNSIEEMTNMFTDLASLRVITLGPDFYFENDCGLEGYYRRQGTQTTYTAAQLINQYPSTGAGTYVRLDSLNELCVLIYDSGEMVFQLGDEEDTSKGNILEILYDNAEHFETTPYSGAGEIPPWSSYNNSITKVTFNANVAPISTAYWFSSMSNLATIENIYNLDTSNVTDMSNMFGYSGIRNLDLSSFDTSNVIYMDYMFFNCSNLVSLDLSGFDTYKLTSMLYMFAQCENLELLDLSSFNTSNVVTMSYMLDGLSNLRILKLGTNFAFQTTDSMLTGTWQRDGDNTIYTANELMNSYNGATMAGTYRNTNMDIYVISYSNGEAVFQIGATPDPSKGSVRGSYSYVETYNSLPTYANNHTINTVTFDTVVSPTSASGFFSDLINLTTINNIENLNTSNTTDMSNMFADCNSLKSLDLSDFKINNGTKTSGMFNNTDSLATLKLGSNSIFNSSGTSLAGYWAKDGTKAVYKAPTLTKLYNGIPMSGTYRRKVKLTINETVKGGLADVQKEFDFQILIFKVEEQDEIYYTEDIDYFGSKSGTIAVTSAGSAWLKGLSLKHGQSVYMYVPFGSDYEYEIEQDNETYSLETTNESGDLSADVTASFTDTLNSPVPTGITSRNLILYVVLFLVTSTLIFIYLADRTKKIIAKQ